MERRPAVSSPISLEQAYADKLCCGQPATAQSESLRVEHHPQPTLTRTVSLSLGDTPTRPLTLARNGGSAEQAYGGRETPKRVPTGVPLESLEGTQG